MDRIGIRELRNYASRVVRRAQAGERLVITVDGVPAAEIGPLDQGRAERGLDDLVAAGQVQLARVSSAAPRPRPVPAPAGRTTTATLREHRDG